MKKLIASLSLVTLFAGSSLIFANVLQTKPATSETPAATSSATSTSSSETTAKKKHHRSKKHAKKTTPAPVNN